MDLLAGFCEKNKVDTLKVIQAAWAVVLGAYANSDAPCSRFIESASSEDSSVYRCSLNNEDPVLSMIQGIEEKNWIWTRQTLGNGYSSSLTAPFDTSLSVVLAGEDPLSIQISDMKVSTMKAGAPDSQAL